MKIAVTGHRPPALFRAYPSSEAKLLATDEIELIKGNYWHDNYWGACSCQACSHKEKNNYLGQILMGIRLATIAKEIMNK